LSATVGIALYPADATEALSLVRAADTAMYRAKCEGRGRYERFSAASVESLIPRSRIAKRR
jgi:GGDEF domain-containing protein